jgi:hypothetical protein
MLAHPRNNRFRMTRKVEHLISLLKLPKKFNLNTRKSKPKRKMLKDLPDDILYSIVEFLNPVCSQERLNVLCNSIIQCAPYLSSFFVKKDSCKLNEHTMVGCKLLCIIELDEYIQNREKSSYYMKHIVSEIASDPMFQVCDRQDAYTFHFQDGNIFREDDPFIQYLKDKLFIHSPYVISHLCCNGKGIYATCRARTFVDM